jgi:hypothetical protein
MPEKMLRPSPDDSVRDAQSKTCRRGPPLRLQALTHTKKHLCGKAHSSSFLRKRERELSTAGFYEEDTPPWDHRTHTV